MAFIVLGLLQHITQTQPCHQGLRVIQKGDMEKTLEHAAIHSRNRLVFCHVTYLIFVFGTFFPASNMVVSNVSLDSESSPPRIVGHDLQRIVPGFSLNCHFEYREDPSVVWENNMGKLKKKLL